MMSNIVDKWREFREWQQRPYQVAKMSEEHHCCKTCGVDYLGNYCPRCGQSAKIGRYSFKNALLLFLDVWGLGNRGMFRTLRDLILRPGYMIRDYISGMQMAYFPPFKLLFLLTALSFVVSSGFNVKGKNFYENTEQTDKAVATATAKDDGRKAVAPAAAKGDGKKESGEKKSATDTQIDQIFYMLDEFDRKHANAVTLSMLFLMSGFMYIFFRRSPNFPDMRFSELLVALVYIFDLCSIFSTTMVFFCVPDDVTSIVLMLPLIPLKQLSGFKWLKFIFIMLASYLAALTLMITVMVVGVAIMRW